MGFLYLLDLIFWYLQKVCTLILVIWLIKQWWKEYNLKELIAQEESFKEDKRF
jgi:hypothetical protein